jgi:hypothetical protein
MFESHLVDSIIEELASPESQYAESHKLCYIGFRPHNTLKLHEQFASEDTYPFKYEHLYKSG